MVDLSLWFHFGVLLIHNANLSNAVHEILFETGLVPSRLELEVTGHA
jgi:EAL domain-containing protein (putative c-di-GMP-specific phosphodiesterase class I)